MVGVVLSQPGQQRILLCRNRRKITVPPFRSDRVASRSIEIEHRFTQPRTRCNYGTITVNYGCIRIQLNKLLSFQIEHPIRGCLEVVDQSNTCRMEMLLEFRYFNLPGKIGGAAMSIDDGTGDTEAGGCKLNSSAILPKCIDHFDQSGKVTAGELLLSSEYKAAIDLCIKSQIGFSTTDISCQYHFSPL